MAKPQIDLSKEELATLYEMFDYFCSKIDFKHSFLDSTAITCMNILGIELRKEDKKYSIE